MPDPADPLEPQPVPTSANVPPPPPQPEINASTLDLPSNIAAALACIPLIGGIIFYILEKNDAFVRFYAMQSIIFGGAWILCSIVYQIILHIFGSIPAIGAFFIVILGLLWAVISIGFLIIFVITVIKAFTGVRWEIPYIGPIARNQVDGT